MIRKKVLKAVIVYVYKNLWHEFFKAREKYFKERTEIESADQNLINKSPTNYYIYSGQLDAYMTIINHFDKAMNTWIGEKELDEFKQSLRDYKIS